MSPDEWGPLLMQIAVIVGGMWGLWSGWIKSRKKLEEKKDEQ